MAAMVSLAFLVVLAQLGCSGSQLVPWPDGGEESLAGDGDAWDGGEQEGGPEEDAPAGCLEIASCDMGALRPDVEKAGSLPACGAHRFWPVICEGSRVRFSLETEGARLVVARLAYPDAAPAEAPLLSLAAARELPDEKDFGAPRSGEFRLEVRALDAEAPATYRLIIQCRQGCERECTRFPLVLVHGWTGFSDIGPIDYFYGVPDHLRRLGYLVSVPALDPYNSTEVRSEQLAAALEAVLYQSRSRRLDIIAHSQGGLDARRAIATLGYGDRVAALVTVATPHHGTPIADIALGLLPGPAQEALAFLLNLIGAAGGNQSDALASFASLTEDYLENEFNPENPDDPRVAYISFAGQCCPLGIGCDDACDVEIGWSHDIIYTVRGDNDGMVPVSSAPWGDFRGVIAADHFDEVGQLLGVTGPNFDHLEFYRTMAASLSAAGH